MNVKCPMSKTLQITVTDEVAQQIKALMGITGHERPGALINILVRRYGQDLARCMSGDVHSTHDIHRPTQDMDVQPSPVASLPTPVNVPLPHEDVHSTQDIVPTSQDISPGNAFLAMDFD